MQTNNRFDRNKFNLIILFIIIFLLTVYFIINFNPLNTPNGNNNEIPSGGDSADIKLERIIIKNDTEIKYLDIEISDLVRYPLLSDVLDAFYNPDKYQNAYKRDNNTLVYNTTGYYAGPLTDYLHERLCKKYSEYINAPYIIKYNERFYSYQESIE